jgi:very-short-patch-repair endonuclease
MLSFLLTPPLEKGPACPVGRGKGGFEKSMLHYNKNLKLYSRELRKNMTDAEKLLWYKIRGRQLKGYQFYRQKIIGNYIVDFYCPKAKLAIELDGGQHYSDEGKEKDRMRDKNIADFGIEVLRFSDREIFESLNSVLEKIWNQL